MSAATLCVICAKPILPTDDSSTVQQVDACTMAKERVSYHSTCLEQRDGPKKDAPK